MSSVVLIPGFMQRGDAWAAVAAGLSPGARVVALDHRTHTLEGRLTEIERGGEGAVLCGYSLGGRLALRAALRDADRYAAVATVGASPGIELPEARSARAAADARLAGWMETAAIEDVVTAWERQPLFADQPEALVAAQRPGRLSHDPRDLALLLRTAGQGTLDPVWHELGGLRLPLLAIAGARDRAYVEVAERMARTAPRGRAAVVEDAGHAPQLQRPDAVARLLSELLAELGG